MSKPEQYTEEAAASRYNSWLQRKIVGAMMAPLLEKVDSFNNPRQPIDKILEVGTGPGISTEYIAQKFANACITGVDISPHMLEGAKESGTANHLVQADIENPLPFKDDTFDLVVAMFTLVHTQNPHEVFDTICRPLKPGGIIALGDVRLPCSPASHPINQAYGTYEQRVYGTGLDNLQRMTEFFGTLQETYPDCLYQDKLSQFPFASIVVLQIP